MSRVSRGYTISGRLPARLPAERLLPEKDQWAGRTRSRIKSKIHRALRERRAARAPIEYCVSPTFFISHLLSSSYLSHAGCSICLFLLFHPSTSIFQLSLLMFLFLSYSPFILFHSASLFLSLCLLSFSTYPSPCFSLHSTSHFPCSLCSSLPRVLSFRVHRASLSEALPFRLLFEHLSPPCSYPSLFLAIHIVRGLCRAHTGPATCPTRRYIMAGVCPAVMYTRPP